MKAMDDRLGKVASQTDALRGAPTNRPQQVFDGVKNAPNTGATVAKAGYVKRDAKNAARMAAMRSAVGR